MRYCVLMREPLNRTDVRDVRTKKRRQFGGTEKLNFVFNDSRTHAGYTFYTTGNGRFVTGYTVASNNVFLQE